MFGELVNRIRTLIHLLRVIGVATGLALIPIGAVAGPAIVPSAQPNFQDPLSNVTRSAAPQIEAPGDPGSIGAGGQIDATPGTSDSDFTIIGDQSTNGLQEPEADDLAQAVRDEILGRSQILPDADERPGAASAAADTTGSTADIVRALVNTVPGQEGAGGGRGPRDARNQDRGFVASVIDDSITDLVVTLLNPEQAADGMVTFSIAGFGDFALLHLQENNSFFVVDLESGSAIKIARGDQSLATNNALQRSTGEEAPRHVGRKTNALQSVISFLEDNVLPFVQSPITLATLGLFSIIWIIWRLSANT